VDFHLPLVTRGAQSGTPVLKTLKLKRERLLLRIHLPFGSEAGTYEVRFRRASDKKEMLGYERTAGKSSASTLRIEDDFSKLPAGSYILAVFAPGVTGEGQGYPVTAVEARSQ
jgi:hypothetical protein